MGKRETVVFLGASVYPRQKRMIAELAKFFGVPQSQVLRGMIEAAHVAVFPEDKKTDSNCEIGIG